MSTCSTYSPFRISDKDDERLNCNDAFKNIRGHLRRQELGIEAPSFCSFHRDSCSDQDQECFRLHRDIIHTILLPLSLLHHQASRIATSVLPSHKGAESERAFRGEARSAYAWLHSVLSEEHDWYLTERCPACIVLHVLHSEPTIRFVAVACLLSDHLQGVDLLSGKRRLPSFEFWFEALETAVREDDFWGDDFWPDIEYRACALTDGVKQLILQCLELRAALDQQILKPQVLYGGRSHSRCDVSWQQQVHPVVSKPANYRKPFQMSSEEQKWFGKVSANRCAPPYWSDRPQRSHTRRGAESRRRSVTS
ncbi:hypothetical protein FE257_012543 [Aspergillus nanangensis]|uniref:Uncharacterized protein n=1 Tax=Aspergillus nanangensis TaxID=2582783 RepID=A0AAD4CWR5_ASPNN|nr:hypothetical protein FE257_012543 [Aspergillus nanangensis]